MYFEVSIPSLNAINSCYQLATTDFDLYDILLPPLKFKPGQQDNVLLPFRDLDECKQYGEELSEQLLTVKDTCLKDKYKLITSRLADAIEKQQLASLIYDKSFRVVGSSVIWKFSSGNTLSISGPMLNKVAYVINERNSSLFLDLSPPLISEHLRIQVRTDDQIELISEYLGKIEFTLQPLIQ